MNVFLNYHKYVMLNLFQHLTSEQPCDPEINSGRRAFFIKRILLIFTFLLSFILPAKADVMPYYVTNINPNSIGVYQAPKNIRVYSEPNEHSQLVLNVVWDSTTFNSPDVSASNLFIVYLPKKELAFLTVLDENEGEDWVQIAYNKNGMKTGWVKKDDEYRFMNWRTFFNLYGRKYGLYYMKDAPDDSKLVYGSCAEDAKSIDKLTLPQYVKVTSVSGNWVLIIGYDVDHRQKIGWITWRNISGEIFLFPDIK